MSNRVYKDAPRLWWCALHTGGTIDGYVIVEAIDEPDAETKIEAMGVRWESLNVGKFTFAVLDSEKGRLLTEAEISAIEQRGLDEMKNVRACFVRPRRSPGIRRAGASDV